LAKAAANTLPCNGRGNSFYGSPVVVAISKEEFSATDRISLQSGEKVRICILFAWLCFATYYH
jgi:hypothetical protein